MVRFERVSPKMVKRRKTSKTTRAAPVAAPSAGTPAPAPRLAATPPRQPGEVVGRRPPARCRDVPATSDAGAPAADHARGAAAWLGAVSPQDGPAALALALLVVVSYLPALHGGFVWDDVIFSEEPVIHSPGALRSIWFAPTDIDENHYWPLVYTSFWLEHRLWGLQPAGYHAVNIFLHLLNCLLLWRLLLRLQVPGALLIAAVFAVHPLHVESVAWIIERKDVLSALFYLGAVLAWLRFAEVERVGHYLLVALLFVAGLLSKSVVVTLPLALLIVQWWRPGRVTRLDLLLVAPLMVLGVVITAADLAFYRGPNPLELGYTLAERMLIAGRALWFYAGKLLWPAELAVIYPLWEIDARSPAGWGYVAAAAALALALWLLRERIGRGPLAGALYFALTLGPVLGFVDYGYMQYSFVADRFQYLAGIGVLAVLIGAAAHGAGKLPAEERSAVAMRYGAGGLAAVVVLLLGTLTWRQAGIYRDDLTLFSYIVALNPQARNAHLNLGIALLEADRTEEGLAASRIAVAQRPEFADAHSTLGRALINSGRFAEAEEHLRRALTLDPNSTHAHVTLGDALIHFKRFAEAEEHLRRALTLDPSYTPAHVTLGHALVHSERFAEAEEHLRRALTLDPDNAAAHQNLAEALRQQRRSAEAIESYRAAVELDPGFAFAYTGMGIALFDVRRYPEALAAMEQALALQPELAQGGMLLILMGRAAREMGRFEVAAEHFQHAAELDPHNVEPLLDLAGVRRRQQRHREAEALLARVRELRTRDPSALHTVAEALRTQGRTEESIAAYRAVLDLHPGFAPSHAALGIALYQMQRYRTAMTSMQRALELDPELPVAALLHLFMARAWAKLGDAEAAAEQYERALALDPDLEIARTGLAEVRKLLSQREQ